MTMTLDDEKPWQPSLWADTAPSAPECATLAGQHEADVAVVGAGYTGLSAALHLAEAGKQVVVLDSHGPGWGCSGRNGGQVNPAWKVLPETLEKKLGSDVATRSIMMANDACDLVFELVSRFGIDCEVQRPGYVQGAYGDHGASFLREWVRQWSDRGVTTTLLRKDEIAAMLGTGVYGMGMLDVRGGSVQPLAYARGLARAAIATGAAVHGNSHVLEVSRAGRGWRVKTASGDLNARHLLWCTNGYTDKTFARLDTTVVPVSSFVVASAPLSSTQRKTVLPGGHAVSETARIQVYYRLDGTGRMVFGGRGNATNTEVDGNTRSLEKQAERMFPELEGIDWQYRWGGHPAMTRDRMPRLMEIGKSAWAAMGYNGRGVAMATMMGRQLSHAVLGGETALPITPLQQIPFHRWRQIGISWHLVSGQVLDRLDT